MSWLANAALFFEQWGKLLVISFITATLQMHFSGAKYTLIGHFMNVLASIIVAYSVASFCMYANVDPDLTTGIIAIATYISIHILKGLNTLAVKFSENPKEFLRLLMRFK